MGKLGFEPGSPTPEAGSLTKLAYIPTNFLNLLIILKPMVLCPRCGSADVFIKQDKYTQMMKIGKAKLKCANCGNEWKAGTTDISKVKG